MSSVFALSMFNLKSHLKKLKKANLLGKKIILVGNSYGYIRVIIKVRKFDIRQSK